MVKNLQDDSNKSLRPRTSKRYINLLNKLSMGSWDQNRITDYVNTSGSPFQSYSLFRRMVKVDDITNFKFLILNKPKP